MGDQSDVGGQLARTSDRIGMRPEAKGMMLQHYWPTVLPKGVHIIELKRFVDESGSFMELFRLDEHALLLDARQAPAAPDFVVRQVNVSMIEADVIRAYHIHRFQTDVWYVPPTEKVLINLVDLRLHPRESSSHPPITRLVMGDGKNQLLRIPPMIAHGYRNLRQRPGLLLYAVDRHFTTDPDSCDEWRLPYDHFGGKEWESVNG